MARKRKTGKNPVNTGRFTGIPHAVMNHQAWLELTGNAIRLLMELAKQYNGYNNGDLTASWSIMKNRGFNSQSTLNAALACLIQLGLVIRTREGFFYPNKRCALYAITWQRIDECKGKYLEVEPTKAPYRCFQLENNSPSPKAGASGSRNRSHSGNE